MVKKHKNSLVLVACLAAVGVNSAFATEYGDMNPVSVSGHDKIYVDTDFDGPDENDPYFSTYHSSAGDCYYVQGNEVQPSGDDAFPFIQGSSESVIQETSECAGMTNMRSPSDQLTATMSSDNTVAPEGNGIVGALGNGACGGLPGGNGNSAGKLVDSTGDETYDAVCGMQTGGLPFALDIDTILYPSRNAKTFDGYQYFQIPNAGLKPSGSSYLGRYDVYIPLLPKTDGSYPTELKDIKANATMNGTELGTLDLTEGVRIGGSNPFNVMTLLRRFIPYPPTPVPAIGPWSLLILMSGILGVTVFGMRRSRSV